MKYMANTISFNTKFGWITATEIGNKISKIEFKKGKSSIKQSKSLKKLKKDLINYFMNKITKIEAPIHFQKNSLKIKIWKEIGKIKKGETKSYLKIAKKFKISPRYVGRICAENQHLLIIPCHRVIRSNGSLGGYSANGGLRLKKSLLRFEGCN